MAIVYMLALALVVAGVDFLYTNLDDLKEDFKHIFPCIYPQES